MASYLGTLLPDFRDAQDALQNVAVAWLRKFGPYDPGRPFVAWALGVARPEAHGASRIWVFIDEHPVSIDAGVFLIHSVSTNYPGTGNVRWRARFPGSLHSNGANLCFADGRVEWRRWGHRRTPTRYTGGPSSTMTDADQADVKWLQGGLTLGLHTETGEKAQRFNPTTNAHEYATMEQAGTKRLSCANRSPKCG